MEILKETVFLLRKEILLEWRQKYAISGIFLYVLSTVFIVYFAIPNIQTQAWNSLFWMVILFASVNAITKSFVQENSNRQLYYYTLVNPQSVILSKMLYNTILLMSLSLLSYAAFSLFVGNPVRDMGMFLLAIFLGSLGFSITFTFISAVAAKASNNATLLAILGFPLIIPILLTLIKLSADALGLMRDSSIDTDIQILVAIDLILMGMSFILFPYLWRD